MRVNAGHVEDQGILLVEARGRASMSSQLLKSGVYITLGAEHGFSKISGQMRRNRA